MFSTVAIVIIVFRGSFSVVTLPFAVFAQEKWKQYKFNLFRFIETKISTKSTMSMEKKHASGEFDSHD